MKCSSFEFQLQLVSFIPSLNLRRRWCFSTPSSDRLLTTHDFWKLSKSSQEASFNRLTMAFACLIRMFGCGSDPDRVHASPTTNAATSASQEEKVPPLAPEAAPTYSIVRSWSLSFENLMKYRHGQKHLAEFLKSEFSDENILFWQACEELKRERNVEKIEEKARIIYEDFISILSPKEVSLDSRVREIVNSNMSNPSVKTFDEAQNQIYVLMQRDSYPRYVASAMYREQLESFGVIEEVVE